MLRDHICPFFCFCFLEPSAVFADPPLPADVSVVSLQCLVSRLIPLAHATSTQKNMAAHIRGYQTFCKLRTLQSFPFCVQSISLYIAYLVTQKRAHGNFDNFGSLLLSHALHVPGKHNQFADCLSCWHSDASACDSFYRLCSD